MRRRDGTKVGLVRGDGKGREYFNEKITRLTQKRCSSILYETHRVFTEIVFFFSYINNNQFANNEQVVYSCKSYGKRYVMYFKSIIFAVLKCFFYSTTVTFS